MSGIRVKQVAHVCIFSSDLERTKQFYGEVLGLVPVFHFTRDGVPFGFYLNAGGRSQVEVFHKPAAAFSETDRINHLCLEVESIDAAVAHIRGRGVEVTEKKLACDDTYQAWVRDPDGTKIELFEYTAGSAQFTGGDRVANW
jgi:lactoylglutathione lyase/glyoxylase I family protein